MRHLNKICETNGGKIKEQDITLTYVTFCTGMDQSQEFWTSEIPGFNLTENTLIGQPR